MESNLVMPKLGLTMELGTIVEWLAREGDALKKGDDFFELESEKVVFTYQATEDCKLLKIIVEPGIEVQVGETVALIEKEGSATEETAGNLSNVLQEESEIQEAVEPKEQSNSVAMASPLKAEETAKIPSSGKRLKASPRARKIAKAENVDLEGVRGSGPGGRIIGDDVLKALADKTILPEVIPDQSVAEINPSVMRKTIQRRLTTSWESPHIYLKTKFDASKVLEIKRIHDVSINTVIAYATIRALKAHPNINIHFKNDKIYQYGSVHIGIAVGIDSGLVVGVVKNSEKQNLGKLHQNIENLIEVIQNNRHTMNQISGGTFTISNLGMFEIDEFTAVINPPEGAILSVGQLNQIPVVRHDQVVIAPYITLVGGFNHNAIDGVQGARFLKTLKTYLEEPTLML